MRRGVLPVPQYFVKSPVFPFNKFPGVDPALGPEMRSTGEVMGVGANFGEAFAKAQISAGTPLPEKGTVFISVNEHHKPEAVAVARKFAALGFQLVATRGTAAVLRAAGLACKIVFKVNEGRPNAVDLLKAGVDSTGGLHHGGRAGVLRRESHPAQRGDASGALHHHDERRARGGGGHGGAQARSHPRVELAGNPRARQCAGVMLWGRPTCVRLKVE